MQGLIRKVIPFGIGFLAGITHAVPEYVPLQERSQGQSLAGASLLNDSIHSNPASSSFTQVYSVAANLLMPRTFDASILDTRTSDIGGSLGYFRSAIGGSSKVSQGAKLGLSARVMNELGLGVTGKMIWAPDRTGADAKLTDVDGGALANFGFVNVGLTVRNIFGGNPQMDRAREISLGSRLNYRNSLFFSAAAHSKWENLRPYQYGFGAEYISPYHFALKGGYYFQPGSPVSAWTAGLSFLSPRLSLHYAVEFPGDIGRSIEHQIGMSLLL